VHRQFQLHDCLWVAHACFVRGSNLEGDTIFRSEELKIDIKISFHLDSHTISLGKIAINFFFILLFFRILNFVILESDGTNFTESDQRLVLKAASSHGHEVLSFLIDNWDVLKAKYVNAQALHVRIKLSAVS